MIDKYLSMKKLIFLFIIFSTLMLGMAACSDDDNDNKSVAIERVEASTDIDLSEYSGLVCKVNGEEYDFVVDNKVVTATPKKGGEVAYTMPYDPEMIGGSSGVHMYLSRTDIAWGQKTDQSTYDKMICFDALIAKKGGNLPSVITDISLVHQYSMISFTTKGMPQGAKITVKNPDLDLIVIPYHTSEGLYQCIAPLAMNCVVSLEVDGVEYQTKTIYYAIQKKSKILLQVSNRFYSFEVVYNAEAGEGEKLCITNGTIDAWVNQHFTEK
jgi:hypothetical protein